ncbi:MAG: hypothetical protein C0596_18025 [Marinilabiliales bacterium]|nr:MAG: hypothetical protein C0596_18025 [Marinilabiliales bacterium]
MSILLIVLIITSCQDEERFYPDPQIEFVTDANYVSGDTVLLLGDTVTIGIHAISQSDKALTHLHYFITNDSEVTRIDTGIHIDELYYSKIVVKNVYETETWSFYVRDRDGRQSDTISITFTKGTESIYGNIRTIDNLTFGAQNNAVIGSFFSFESNGIFDLQEAYQNQEKINLLYFYDFIDGDENTISSPGANIDESVYGSTYGTTQWDIKNTTRFIYQEDILPEEFDQCQNDSLILFNTFEFITGKRKSKNLTADDIYSFVTEDGNRGLFKVNEVIGTDEGEITITIKMQE